MDPGYSTLRGGYYLRIRPGESFLAGGFWEPNKDDLYRIRKEIEVSFTTKISDVSVSAYNTRPNVSVNYHALFSVDSIKDMILIEDYMSDDSKTPEEFVTYIADKIIK